MAFVSDTRVGVAFDANSHPERVTTLVRSLAFSVDVDGPDRRLTLSLSDAAGTRVTATIGVDTRR